MSETPNTTTESKVEEIRDELRATALEAFNASPSTGFQAGFDAAVDAVAPLLAAALSEEGQGEVGHRLSRKVGERLEEIAYWCEKHGMDPSAASYLRRLSQGILSEPVESEPLQRIAAVIREALRIERISAAAARESVKSLDRELHRGEINAAQYLRDRLEEELPPELFREPAEDDVGRLREKLLSKEALEAVAKVQYGGPVFGSEPGQHAFDHVDGEARDFALLDARRTVNALLDAVALTAPDVERLGGDPVEPTEADLYPSMAVELARRNTTLLEALEVWAKWIGDDCAQGMEDTNRLLCAGDLRRAAALLDTRSERLGGEEGDRLQQALAFCAGSAGEYGVGTPEHTAYNNARIFIHRLIRSGTTKDPVAPEHSKGGLEDDGRYSAKALRMVVRQAKDSALWSDSASPKDLRQALYDLHGAVLLAAEVDSPQPNQGSDQPKDQGGDARDAGGKGSASPDSGDVAGGGVDDGSAPETSTGDQPKDCGGSGWLCAECRQPRSRCVCGVNGLSEDGCPGCSHPECPKNRAVVDDTGWPPERVYIRKGSEYYWLTEDGAADGNDDDSLWAEFVPAPDCPNRDQREEKR